MRKSSSALRVFRVDYAFIPFQHMHCDFVRFLEYPTVLVETTIFKVTIKGVFFFSFVNHEKKESLKSNGSFHLHVWFVLDFIRN